MCKDWLGKIIDYDVLFECLNPGCKERYPLDLCHSMEEFHHCDEVHDINLNVVRELFGQYLTSMNHCLEINVLNVRL